MGKKVAFCIIESADNKFLLGNRRDNHKWTFAGGTIEPNEKPKEAIKREVMEEVGLLIDPILLDKIDNLYIYYYQSDLTGQQLQDKAIGIYDPDQEMKFYNAFDIKDLKKLSLQVPYEDNNIVKIIEGMDMDSVNKNLLQQIKDEPSAVKKLKLIKEFSNLSAIEKMKIIKEFNNKEDLIAEAMKILDKNENITLEDLEWFSDEKIEKLESMQGKDIVEAKLDKLLRLFEISLDSVTTAKQTTLKKAFEDLFLDKGADNNKHLQERRNKAIEKIRAMIKGDLEVRQIFENMLNRIDDKALTDAIFKDYI